MTSERKKEKISVVKILSVDDTWSVCVFVIVCLWRGRGAVDECVQVGVQQRLELGGGGGERSSV